MNGLFITATGTEVGETMVTASLCYQLMQAGRAVTAIKPVISDFDEADASGSDTAVIAESLGMALTADTVNAISPFRYQAPLAPSMAAKAEGRTLDYAALINTCETSLRHNPFTLIEGVGGSFVPLTDEKLVADWIKDLGLPSVVVAGSYLGTLSHLTATVEAMQARGLAIKAVVMSQSEGSEHPDFEATLEQARIWCAYPVIALPRLAGNTPWKHAPDLLSALL